MTTAATENVFVHNTSYINDCKKNKYIPYTKYKLYTLILLITFW